MTALWIVPKPAESQPATSPAPAESRAGALYRIARLERAGLFDAVRLLRQSRHEIPALREPDLASRLAQFDPARVLMRTGPGRRQAYRRTLGPDGSASMDALIARLGQALMAGGSPCARAHAGRVHDALRERAQACPVLPAMENLEALAEEAASILDAPALRGHFDTFTGWGVLAAVTGARPGATLRWARMARSGRAVLQALDLPAPRLVPLIEEWAEAARLR